MVHVNMFSCWELEYYAASSSVGMCAQMQVLLVYQSRCSLHYRIITLSNAEVWATCSVDSANALMDGKSLPYLYCPW